MTEFPFVLFVKYVWQPSLCRPVPSLFLQISFGSASSKLCLRCRGLPRRVGQGKRREAARPHCSCLNSSILARSKVTVGKEESKNHVWGGRGVSKQRVHFPLFHSAGLSHAETGRTLFLLKKEEERTQNLFGHRFLLKACSCLALLEAWLFCRSSLGQRSSFCLSLSYGYPSPSAIPSAVSERTTLPVSVKSDGSRFRSLFFDTGKGEAARGGTLQDSCCFNAGLPILRLFSFLVSFSSRLLWGVVPCKTLTPKQRLRNLKCFFLRMVTAPVRRENSRGSLHVRTPTERHPLCVPRVHRVYSFPVALGGVSSEAEGLRVLFLRTSLENGLLLKQILVSSNIHARRRSGRPY